MDQACHSASVTRPESLALTFVGFGEGQQSTCPTRASAPDAMGGLARWSSTKRRSGRARAVSTATGSSRVRTSRSKTSPAAAHGPEPAADVVAGQPSGVCLSVDAMAQPDEQHATRPRAQPRDGLRDVRGREVHPGHHAEHVRHVLRQREQIARLVDRRQELHEHGPGDAVPLELGPKIVGTEALR